MAPCVGLRMYCEMIPLGSNAYTGANAGVMPHLITKARKNCSTQESRKGSSCCQAHTSTRQPGISQRQYQISSCQTQISECQGQISSCQRRISVSHCRISSC